MYRNMRYILDRARPLQVPCAGSGLGWDIGLVLAIISKYLSRRRGRGNVGIPTGFPKSVGSVGKPALWLSMLSILCHFHGLL